MAEDGYLDDAYESIEDRDELIRALAVFVDQHITLDGCGLPGVYFLSRGENPPVNFVELTPSQNKLLEEILTP